MVKWSSGPGQKPSQAVKAEGKSGTDEASLLTSLILTTSITCHVKDEAYLEVKATSPRCQLQIIDLAVVPLGRYRGETLNVSSALAIYLF